MPRVDVGGHEIAYEEHGQGPPVVLVHSLFFDRTIYDDMVQALADAYRVITVDVRDHGASDLVSQRWDLWEAGQDITTLLDRIDATPAHWVGLSMGGMIGLRVALSQGDHLASLTLLDTSAEAEDRATLHKAMAALARIGKGPVIRLMMPYVTDQMFSRRFQGTDGAEAWTQRVTGQDPGAIYRSAMAVFDREPVVDRLGEIDLPTFVLVGELDQATPPAVAEVIHGGIPGARRALIPGAGHMSVIERPTTVHRLVRPWLDEVAGPTDPERATAEAREGPEVT